jgi:hypothetical protein
MAVVSIPDESIDGELPNNAFYRDKGFRLMAGFTFPL